MFRVEQNVPDVYVNESRDFQLYSRLYDLVFQSARFSIDSMEQVSDTMRCNDKLLPLIATKVGFFTDLNLTNKSDRQLLSAFPYIVRYKGSLKGIELVAHLFERIMNVKVEVESNSDDRNRVTLKFHDYPPNVSLLYALLNYIRPTGLFVDYAIISDLPATTSGIDVSDTVKVRTMLEYSEESGKESGIVTQLAANHSECEDVASNIGFTQIKLEGATSDAK